ELAAAYCLETGTAADEYLALLAEYPADMYTAAVEGGDMQRTVARVWHVTLDRLADDPLAVTILLTVSWFAPDDIPRSLLDGLGTPPAVRRAIGRLSAHSMVTLHGTTTLSVHRLVQAVSRTPDLEDPHRRAGAVAEGRDTAAKCLVRVLPDDDTEDPSNWPVWRTLLPHVEALAAHAAPDADTPDLVRVFSRMGKFAGDQQLRSRAKRLLSRGEEGTLRLLGPDHPLTLTARNRLIDLVPLPLEQALDHVARCVRVFGERHPEALTARYELTASYLDSGDLEGAIRNAELAVEMRCQVLGFEHPETLRARFGGLMAAGAGGGDLEALASATETLLDDCVRSLGERHQLTLDVRVLWVQLMSDVGRSLAVPVFAVAHPRGHEKDDLGTILERLREELGPERVREWAVASIPEATRRLADCETALGREHGDTVAARLHLAQMHLGAEDFGTALL
ncbi:tetratricopeptide repeat protein, partial [Streptomyces paradoxus]|uniref:tetratricopeptide repeat protein n=1 Tax=Streptomyces paradoxus TaxID=66375 RepID=UPI00362A114B